MPHSGHTEFQVKNANATVNLPDFLQDNGISAPLYSVASHLLKNHSQNARAPAVAGIKELLQTMDDTTEKEKKKKKCQFLTLNYLIDAAAAFNIIHTSLLSCFFKNEN